MTGEWRVENDFFCLPSNLKINWNRRSTFCWATKLALNFVDWARKIAEAWMSEIDRPIKTKSIQKNFYTYNRNIFVMWESSSLYEMLGRKCWILIKLSDLILQYRLREACEIQCSRFQPLAHNLSCKFDLKVQFGLEPKYIEFKTVFKERLLRTPLKYFQKYLTSSWQLKKKASKPKMD